MTEENAADSKPDYYWGVDCGSSEIKVVVCDRGGGILEKRKTRTLFPLMDHVHKVLSSTGGRLSPLAAEGAGVKPDHHVTTTGYGRNHIAFAQERLTEIKAHYLGVRAQVGLTDYTIVDIGGQDSKVISVRNAELERFVINRKCAAGTGAFIEELASRLEIRLEDLSELEKKHDKKLMLNSYCTVFAGQEVIKVLMNGEKVENLIHALYASVAKRVLEMTLINTPAVVFSGGVMQYHPALVGLFQGMMPEKKLQVAVDAQFCGAIGAALHGITAAGTCPDEPA